MLRRRDVRRLALAVISEVVDVARACGVTLEPVAGTLDLQRLYLPPARRRGGLAPDLLVKHTIMLAVGLKFRRLKSSMLQSLERGRYPEIDFMNGYVADRAGQAGLAAPLNTALAAMVREIAGGTRPITPANLAALPAP
jgi:2-dehydropantoate 2-reductase